MGIKVPDQVMFIKNNQAVQKQSTVLSTGKICVITGATSGVGYQAAAALAAKGATLVLVARNEAKVQAVKQEFEQLYGNPVDYVLADFTDLDQVKAAGAEILQRYPRIDVLINSAGIYTTKKSYNHEGIELVFCVNHMAAFVLTQLLKERLIASAPARIIQINSEGHRFNGLNTNDLNWHKRIYTGLRGYGAAKTAQLLTVWQFATELNGTGVTINAMHPGAVKTNIGENNGRLYRWFLHHVTWKFLQDPKVAGEAIYYLATAPELAETTGKFFNLTIEEKPAKHAYNINKQRIMWEKSLAIGGFQSEIKTQLK
ncbi:MAG: SDR family NAD(P)-dependent oxidoreductase [Culicoidibacterales bacterium]